MWVNALSLLPRSVQWVAFDPAALFATPSLLSKSMAYPFPSIGTDVGWYSLPNRGEMQRHA